MRKFFAVAALLLIGGCDDTSSTQTSAPTLSPKQAILAKQKQTTTTRAIQTHHSKSDKRKVKLLKAYLKDFCPSESDCEDWYVYIQKIEIEGDEIKVYTDITRNAMYDDLAKRMCGTINGFAVSTNNQKLGLKRITIFANDGNTFDSCGG